MKHSKKKKGSMYPGGGHFKKKPNANMPKQQMRMGGKLKPVNKEDNPGLAKLAKEAPEVVNKMGYSNTGFKNGGAVIVKTNQKPHIG